MVTPCPCPREISWRRLQSWLERITDSEQLPTESCTEVINGEALWRVLAVSCLSQVPFLGGWRFGFQVLEEEKLVSKSQWKGNPFSAQSCPTLCDPMDYTGHGILQARILQWVTFPLSRGSNLGLPHCMWILHQLSHKGSPISKGRGD